MALGDRLMDFVRGARSQQIRPGSGAAIKDFSHLIGRLALAVDDLREAAPDCPMMIDFRKAEILEGHRAKSGDRLVDGSVLASDGLEKCS